MAGSKLSNDGKRYPIEPLALPLVYALSALRIVEPCWSCEGHAGTQGECKQPEVWFYSGSVVYPGLLQRHVCRLASAGTLSTRWEVALCSHQPETAVTLFVIRPDRSPGVPLQRLQQDLRRISANLRGELRQLAEEMLDRLPPCPDIAQA